MALTADWMLPVGLGIFGTLIAYLFMMKKPQPIRVKAKRTRR
jgi:hypothetical protein